MLVSALEAHERLAQIAPFGVLITEVPRALAAFSACFVRTAWHYAFHGEYPTQLAQNRREPRFCGMNPNSAGSNGRTYLKSRFAPRM